MEERARKLISSRNLESNLHLTVSKRASGIVRQKASLSLSKQRASSNVKPFNGEDFTMKDSDGKLLTTEINLQMMLGNEQDFLDSDIQIESNYASAQKMPGHVRASTAIVHQADPKEQLIPEVSRFNE